MIIKHKSMFFNKYVYMCVFICILMFMLHYNIRNIFGMDSEGNIVVVLDPGHGGLGGGSDDGASYNGATERFINLTVANAAKQELEKYDKVKVYLTRNSADESVTLKNRAKFAESVNADFVFSMHFNASEGHKKYGAEVWIPSIGRYYSEGYKFAEISVDGLEKMGLFIRGIKTRVGDGEDEYYGIIRECEHRDIPAVIIEHCYLDNMYNYSYYSDEEALKEFGRADAEAIAKYFRLKSSENDYSEYHINEVEQPAGRVYQDTSEPDFCEISLNNYNSKTGSLSFDISARDKDSHIIYYSYSLDGGLSFSDIFEWRDTDNDDRITVLVNNVGTKIEKLAVRVYNTYDLSSDSNVIELINMGETTDNIENDNNKNENDKNGNSESSDDNSKSIDKNEDSWKSKVKVIIGIILVTGGITVTVILINRKRM